MENVTLFWFKHKLRDDDRCRTWIRRRRWPDGFVCPDCGCTAHSRLPANDLYFCHGCRRQTSLTAGTVFHRARTTQLNLLKRFRLIWEMADAESGIALRELADRLKIRNYKVAWHFAEKVRTAMNSWDPEMTTVGLVELGTSTDLFATAHSSPPVKSRLILVLTAKKPRIKRESPAISNVLSLAGTGTGIEDAGQGLLDMAVPSGERQTIIGMLSNSDWDESMVEVPDIGGIPLRITPTPDEAPSLFTDAVGSFIGHAVRSFYETHRCVSSGHLSGYLAEACFRHGRGYPQIEKFARLLNACVTYRDRAKLERRTANAI